MDAKTFYTYLYLRENDGAFPAGTPYYCGKGKGRRVHSTNRCAPKPTNPACILIQESPTEQDAFAAEKFLISYFGRIDQGTGCLRNLTDGGEGASNPSKERREALRQQMQGNRFRKGHAHSLETKRLLGEIFRVIGKRPVNLAHLAKIRTPEHQRAAGFAKTDAQREHARGLGGAQGRTNVENGHLDRIRHLVNLGLVPSSSGT